MATPAPNSILDPSYNQWQIENPGWELDENGKPARKPTNSDGSPVTGQQMDEQQAAAAKAEAERIAAEKARAEAVRAYEARFQYGGHAGGAFEAANRYNQRGEQGQLRTGEQIDYTKAEWDRQQAGQARNLQGEATSLMAARARGQVPSIAQMQANRAIGRAVADQSSIAAGARGPAALALAQQQAAGNSANAISGINQDAMVAAAQERERAEQNYFNAATGIRGGDFQAGGMAAQQAQQQAAINAAQRAQNDQYQLGMTQAEMGVQQSQLGAQGNKVAVETGQAVAAANRASAESMHSKDRIDKYGTALVAAGGASIPILLSAFSGGGDTDITGGNASDGFQDGYGGGSTGADAGGVPTGGPPDDDEDPDPMSDARAKRPASLMAMRAKGGPVRAGKSYLVGEEGPELIVPREPGHVLTAEETRSLVGERGSTAVGRALAEGPRDEPNWLADYMKRGDPADRPVSEEMDAPPRWLRDEMGEGEEDNVAELDATDIGDADAAPPRMPAPAPRMPRMMQSLERHNNPGLDRRIREMVQAQQAQNAMLGESSTSRAIARNSMDEDEYERLHREAGPPPSMMAMRARRAGISDDRAKLAAAWDEGHKAAADDAAKLARYSPEELKRVAEDPNHPTADVAKAVRESKAEAYDEGKGGERAPAAPERYRVEKQYPLPPEEPKPAGRTATFQREMPPPRPVALPPSGRAAQARDTAPPSWSPMSRMLQSRGTYSDERTKVGTLGPQVSSREVASFARSMKGTPYTYREEYAAREGQRPGEVNVGPVAQDMEKSKIGRTIVKPDPAGSGMRTIDQSKLVKALGSVAADHQDQLDEQNRRISLMALRMGRAAR